MKARIVRIGNSQGIRIPRPLLNEAGLGEEVELEARPGEVIIRAVRRPRSTWAEAFERMAAEGDDAILDTGTEGSAWDENEWTW